MTDAELHTKEKTKCMICMNCLLFIQKKTYNLFVQNERKLLSAKLANKGACNIKIVGAVKYSVSDYSIGHAKMLRIKFYWITINKAIFIEFENLHVIVTSREGFLSDTHEIVPDSDR